MTPVNLGSLGSAPDFNNAAARWHPTHALDCLNLAQAWRRAIDDLHQVKAVFMASRFMNDTIRWNVVLTLDSKSVLELRGNHRD